MKEKISTIPLIDAFKAEDECPLCYLARVAEEHAISFVLGSGATYMESEVRDKTDEAGFCRMHYKKMYDYGNRLGSAMILQTHLKKLNQEMSKEMAHFQSGPASKGFFKKKSKSKDTATTSLGSWINQTDKSCYICNHMNEVYDRYLLTFFDLYKNDGQFRELFDNSKGFCLPHFRDLTEMAESQLNAKAGEAFRGKLFGLMEQNIRRLEEEISWFIEKFDFRNKDADWKNSRDSVQRVMQKVAGGYPADAVFKED